ncbi:intercellular adhesion molecule 5 isoform X2 [Acipenser ruthenus]|uniref:intercellular adhesion molecule 5 isoform X2 n=1 Tax=Acipenser ruthenus TaxID=7906 RepID=UPI0027420652|nr:intercellular adhesion molecule 5 isoform X2 [Acipenser ruthenus]
MEFGSLMRDMFLGLLCFAVTGAASAVCDVNIDHSGVVVRFGDPVTANCSTTREDVLGAGWDSSVNPVNEPDSTTAFWNASSLTVWDAKPKCLINFNNETELPECIFLFAPEFMKIDNGSNIKCLVLGEASAQSLAVQFYKGDDQIAGSDNVTHNGTQFPVNATITFTKNHGVNYTCTAELDFGPEAPIQNTSPPYATSTIGPGEEKLNMSSLPYTMSPKAAASPVCDVNIDPSRVVVRFGDPVTVDCSTTREDVLGAGWESSVNPVNETNSKIAVWNVSSLTVWDAEPKCFINCMNEPRQCVEKLDLVIYKYPESVSLIAPEFMKIGVESNITCQVLDVAPARYLSVKLYKGDEQLVNRSFTHNSTRFPVNESVHFPVTPTRGDNGSEYTCVAELQLGPGEPIKNASLPFRMLPIAASPVCDVNIDPSRVVVRFGDPVTVNCSTTREDVLGAGWESSVNPVNEMNSKIAVWNVSSLTVWDAEPKCFINYNNEPRQCVKKLDLVIYKYPESVSLIAPGFMKIGVESNITCQVLDVAPIRYLSVKLYKGDEQLVNRSFTHNSTRFPVNESVPFPVTPTRADNGLEYTCVAELQLELGEPIKNSSLPFRMLPIDFEEQPILNVSENVEVNQPSTVRCELKNAFPPEEVQVELLINNEIHTIRSNMDNVYVEESFTLDSVEPAVITCNVSLRSLSKSASRNVQGYVLPEPTLHTEAVLVNQTGIVTCSVDGSFPANATQRLLLNGLIVNETHNSTPAQYEFKAEKELNGKMITCETELKLAATSVKKNQSITFSVLYEPSVINPAEESVPVLKGDSVVFNCTADGIPAPTYTWKHPEADNVNITTKDSVSTVTITGASSSNHGVYECHAWNIHGNSTRKVTVEVTGNYTLLLTLVAVAAVAVVLLVSFVYKKKRTSGRYTFLPTNPSSANGSVAENGQTAEDIPLTTV